MIILGIDYGRRKVGLALGNGKVAQPLKTLRWTDRTKLYSQIEKIVTEEKVEKVVVGVSEGEMAKESIDFAKELEGELEVGVFLADETLSTKDAQRLSREAGIKRKKRKNMEDAYAAAIMLQSYLDV